MTKAALGRPKGYDRNKVAKLLIEWAKKNDSINLNKFCITHDPAIPPATLIRWTKEDDSFRESYEIAKAYLGFRREEWLNSEALHVKAYDLNASNYDLFLREEKRQQAEFESSLKQKEENTQQQKVVFEVNYKNDTDYPVSISSPSISATHTSSP